MLHRLHICPVLQGTFSRLHNERNFVNNHAQAISKNELCANGAQGTKFLFINSFAFIKKL